jgi:chromosome partitioning protein
VVVARGRGYFLNRTDNEHLQVIAVTNFKGGSENHHSRSSRAVFGGARLSRVGHRPRPTSKFAYLFGLQAEFDVENHQTMYAALRRYDKKEQSRCAR